MLFRSRGLIGMKKLKAKVGFMAVVMVGVMGQPKMITIGVSGNGMVID